MGSPEVKQLNESLYELYRPQNIVPRFQVVLFHGFQHGSYENAHLSTWLSEDGSCIWPKTWLKEEFPDAQILSVSYNGMLNQNRGTLDLHVVVENLISDLLMENVGQEPRCPVVLVGHSFGGLIIKQLSVRACNQTGEFKRESPVTLKLTKFLENLKGLFFYATPHHGTTAVDPELLTADSPLIEYVKTLSNPTSRLNDDFDHLKDDKWTMAGVGESLPSKWGTFEGLVVREASSRRGQNFNIVQADHTSISRPRSKSDRRFYALTQLLTEIVTDSEDNERPENWQDLPESVTGIKQVLQEIKDKLRKTPKLGLVGMGGIGKTTLSMALFNDIECHYDFTCFVRDVKDIGGPIKNLENAVLENIHHRGSQVVEKGPGLKLKMKRQKLLLVLDAVNSERDLEIVKKFANEFDIHKESRFVATSRNKELLESYQFEVHHVPYLSPDSSKDFFLSCAPNGLNLPFLSYVDDIVEKCDGLPLSLRVVGKYLKTKAEESIWKEIVPTLERARAVADFDKKLWAILRLSYDDLSGPEKNMFLDATTVFYKSQLSTAQVAWNNVMGWRHLLDLSLVWEIRDGDSIEIGMHEQLLDMGRNIGSTSQECGRRIWNNGEKAFEILSNDSYSVEDMKDIVALKVCSGELYSQRINNSAGTEWAPQNYVTVWGRQLCKMKNLQYLWLEGVHIDDSHETLPSTIVYLHLSSMNFSDFPFNPSRHKLMAILSLRNVDGFRTVPATFYHLRSLQILRIEGNNTLNRLHRSFGTLRKLKHLIIERCPSLRMLPYSLGQLEALETLEIGSCESLLGLPESIGQLVNLKEIRTRGCCRLQKLPLTFHKLQALERIQLNETSLEFLWNVDFDKLKSLKSLQLNWKQTAKFPHSLPECLRAHVTRMNYQSPFTFNVMDGILDRATPGNFQHFRTEIFGIDKVLVEAESKLKSRGSLGLVGMAGIGKTTVGMALFNKLAPAYEYTCFIRCVNDIKCSLRYALVKDMHYCGKRITKKEGKIDLEFLKGARLLLTLDGVTLKEHLEILRILRKQVHAESRFIITSRDFALCKEFVGEVIRVPFLEQDSSRQLLLAIAGRGLTCDDDIEDIFWKCGGLPLSLEVVGRYLHTESEKLDFPGDRRQQLIWALDNHMSVCRFDESLWAPLTSSYDALDRVEQDMFLDAATVFYRSDLSIAKAAWSVLTNGQHDKKWQRLVDLSLVCEICDSDKVEIGMQAQLQSLGRRLASTRGGNGRRIWNDPAKAFELLSAHNYGGDDVKDVVALKCCTHELHSQIIGEAQGLVSAAESYVTVQVRALCEMDGLQYLWLEGFDFDQDCDLKLPSTLVDIRLSSMKLSVFPFNPSDHSRLAILCLGNIGGFRTLPANFSQLKCLQILKIEGNSTLESLPDSLTELALLKHLSIQQCHGLRHLPDSLGHLVALETLEIGFCRSLRGLPDSIGNLRNLQGLSIVRCDELESLPDSIGNLRNLQRLSIERCDELESLPDPLGRLLLLKDLSIERCPSLRRVNDSLGQLLALESLSIHFCPFLGSLPESMWELRNLQRLSIEGCDELEIFLGLRRRESIPNDVRIEWCPSLGRLMDSLGLSVDLESWRICSCSSLRDLPESIRKFQNTQRQSIVWFCSSLQGLPDSIGNLRNLQRLSIQQCDELETLPDSLGSLSMLEELGIECCPSLRHLPDSLGHLVALKSLRIGFCRSLRGLPDSIGNLRNLQRLSIGRCDKLESLPDSLGSLSMLEELGIEWCPSLRHLPDSLGHLVALETLEICRSLRVFPDSIGNLRNLKGLSIEGCDELESLPDSLGSLSMLEELGIEWCPRLRHLPDSLGHLVALETLEIGFCRSLGVFPDSIGNLRNLQRLSIGRCDKLESLPDSLGSLSMLEELGIEWCPSLRHLPDSLGHLVALETLEIGFCRSLRVFPDSIGNLRNLQGLSIEGCDELESLPDSLGSLSMLEELRIEWCPSLGKLSDDLGELMALKSLRIGFCRSLRGLPDSIGNLRNLQRLSIEQCEELESLPDSLGSLSMLKELRIEWCPSLGKLSDDLGELMALKSLRIGFCRSLRGLPDSIGNLRNLQGLSIVRCDELESLPDSIGNLRNLQRLSIERCDELESLPDSLGSLSMLEELRIEWCPSLGKLSDDLGELMALNSLRIGFCRSLRGLPDSIGNLRNLQWLSIEGCDELEIFLGLWRRESIPNDVRIEWCPSLGRRMDSLGLSVDLESWRICSCSSLRDLRESIRKFQTTQRQSIVWFCSSLQGLPKSIGNLGNVQRVSIDGFDELESSLDSLGRLPMLKDLTIQWCPGFTMLSDLGKLVGLESLSILGCGSVEGLPESIGNLESLRRLNIERCKELKSLPDSMGSLQNLHRLTIEGCVKLKSFPDSLRRLPMLEDDIKLIEDLGRLPMLEDYIKWLEDQLEDFSQFSSPTVKACKLLIYT